MATAVLDSLRILIQDKLTDPVFLWLLMFLYHNYHSVGKTFPEIQGMYLCILKRGLLNIKICIIFILIDLKISN